MRLLLSLLGTSLLLVGCVSTPEAVSVRKISSSDAGETIGSIPVAQFIGKFNGQPYVHAEARIVYNQGDADPSLVIFHGALDYSGLKAVLRNHDLGLAVPGYDGNKAGLAVGPNGSLNIHQTNTRGRDKWNRVLTVSFSQGEYLISGFALNYVDTLDATRNQKCEYDLSAGTGILNGRSVTVHTKSIPLKSAKDGESLYSCKNW